MILSSENFTAKLDWCKNQSKGIKLVEPNSILAKTYLTSAKETINFIDYNKQANSNLWLATHKYYFLYFCTYAVLIKMGIKSEIHDCTISLIKEIERQKIINLNISDKLAFAKIQRINNQYYMKNEQVNIDEKELTNIFLNTKRLIDNITQQEINKARRLIQINKSIK
jgi:uncharacterized protein (UPF0332 family)